MLPPNENVYFCNVVYHNTLHDEICLYPACLIPDLHLHPVHVIMHTDFQNSEEGS